MITPYPHQESFAELCWQKLKELGYVYLAGKPRSGKTYTSILIAEKSTKISRVLVLTKKAAIPGWNKFIVNNSLLKHKYTVTNYEQIGIIKNDKPLLKLKPEDFDLVIIDESHNIGAFPKPSDRWKLIKFLCYNLPHIHLSGTAIVESPCSIYHQMTISKFKPFKHKNFYDFHKEFGEPYFMYIGGRQATKYDKAKITLLDEINKFTIYMTQEDAGISKDLQAQHKIHYITLENSTRELYNKIQADKVVTINKKQLVCDSTMKLRTSLHMLESGVLKIDNDYILLGNTEKVDYIKKTFGDHENLGIMCHFIGEKQLLEKEFKYAKIFSSSAHAEGVDLSYLKDFVILSSDYSGAKFIQRCDRIVNINGSNTLTVHHILVKKAISEQVYNVVSKKEDFNNKTYVKQKV